MKQKIKGFLLLLLLGIIWLFAIAIGLIGCVLFLIAFALCILCKICEIVVWVARMIRQGGDFLINFSDKLISSEKFKI